MYASGFPEFVLISGSTPYLAPLVYSLLFPSSGLMSSAFMHGFIPFKFYVHFPLVSLENSSSQPSVLLYPILGRA